MIVILHVDCVKIATMVSHQISRSTYHHGDLRAALVAAAESLLATNTPLSLRSVAKAAGVSHAAPYHHFANLDALIAAVATRGFHDLATAMKTASPNADSAAVLAGHCTAYVDFALARPSVFRLMFSPLLQRKTDHPALQAAADEAFEVLRQAAHAYAAEGADELALAGWSLAHGLASLAIDGALSAAPVAMPSPHTLAQRLADRLLSKMSAPD